MTAAAATPRYLPRPTPSALLTVLLGLLAAVGACRSVARARPVPQVSQQASAAFEEARTWARSEEPEARRRSRLAAERAARLAPDWVAPRRLLDDLLRADLLGLEALAAHRRRLDEGLGDAAELYLAGRLEGDEGARRFELAVRLDPGFAWGHHGLGWEASRRGRLSEAIGHERRALRRARDPWERAYFASTLARYYDAADESRRALDTLEARLKDEETAPVDRIELAVQAATIELSMVFQPEYRQGYRRALELLRSSDLTDAETERLVLRMRAFRFGDGERSLELELALAARPGRARDRLRAELMLETQSTPLALGLLRRSAEAGEVAAASGPLLRAARFAAGQFAYGVDEWAAELPRRVLDADGLPRDERLAAVMRAARALGPDPDPAELLALGELAIAAGWFREARSVASAIAVHDLDGALALENRAASGLELLIGIRRQMQDLDRMRRGGAAAPVKDLEGLLDVLASHVARARGMLGGESDLKRVSVELRGSPRLRYAGVGSLVHPGPWFSVLDEEAGLGAAGEPVPGLAALFAELGRFGVFGQMLGAGGPDGTLLQRVLAEEDRGVLLGVPWQGTLVWCEGADVRTRAGRAGAEISGAALHEGFWIDLSSVRRERRPWARLEREFMRDGDPARMERALSTRGLELTVRPGPTEARRRERRGVSTLLGQADLVRLAVLRDRLRDSRLAPGEARGLVRFDEHVDNVALHEAGHLCDRTRFLPLSQHVGRVARFALANGLSPARIMRRLEYRAELVALCEAAEPRLVLATILSAGERGGNGVTPHAAAYTELLEELLLLLDRELERRPADWPELDPDHVLAHQLHLVDPEKIRGLARRLAEREGLFTQ